MENTQLPKLTTEQNDDAPQEAFIQKWAIRLAAAVLVTALCVYSQFFSGGISYDHERWGTFGDFLGGVVNPVVGFLTIWLLSISLKQNQEALRQSQKELRLASRAIEQTVLLQETTEKALNTQIRVADETRDFTNAITILKHSDEINTELRAFKIKILNGEDFHMTLEQVEAGLKASGERCVKLRGIMEGETQRLVNRYSK